MFTTDADLKAENEELKKELLKTKNKVRKLNEKCESYEDRLQGFVQDRAQLLDSLHVLESMKLEIKQFDIDQMQINEDRLSHRVEVTKKLLDENRARVEELEAELKSTQDDLADLTEEHNNTVLKNNQEIYSLKSRLDIAYTKLAESQYVINEFDNQGFWARIRNKKPEDLDEVVISKTSNFETAEDDVKALDAAEEDAKSLDAIGEDAKSLDAVEDDVKALESGEGSVDAEDSDSAESLEAEEVSTDMESSELEEQLEENTDEHSEN